MQWGEATIMSQKHVVRIAHSRVHGQRLSVNLQPVGCEISTYLALIRLWAHVSISHSRDGDSEEVGRVQQSPSLELIVNNATDGVCAASRGAGERVETSERVYRKQDVSGTVLTVEARATHSR